MKKILDYQRYNIKVGQKYKRADGSKGIVIVRDILTYADCGDVVIYDSIQNIERRIDCFELAKCQYTLI
jgi:hypothetical protein